MRFSNLTVTGSARAPIHLWASAASGLGPGNALTGNATDAIEVMGIGPGGVVPYDASWQPSRCPTGCSTRSPWATRAARS